MSGIEPNEEMLARYTDELKAVSGVKYFRHGNDTADTLVFKSRKPNSLSVTLCLHKKSGNTESYLAIEIDKADCGYWHTIEVDSLDYHIKLAKSALKGDVAYNRSPLLRLKEVCFKLDGKWVCTRKIEHNEDYRFHYIATRKKIKEYSSL